jgi:DNA-binding transcriptional LysR family regulator
MNTDFFLEFEVLSKFEDYGEAAEQLLISESTLSRHIQALENEVGVRLFDRTSRKVKLNPYGKIFLPYARQFITLQHQYSHDIAQAKYGKETVSICSFYYIDDFLFLFHAYDKNTGVTSVNIGNASSHNWQDFLRRGICEFVFAINPLDNENEFSIIPFETDYYTAVLHPSHPLAVYKSVSLKELANENFISFKDKTFSDLQLKDLCMKAGFNPKIIFNADTGSAIASVIGEGIGGVSLLLRKNLIKMKTKGVSLIELEPETSIQVSICYSKAVPLSSGAKQLLRFAVEKWPELKIKNSFRKSTDK